MVKRTCKSIIYNNLTYVLKQDVELLLNEMEQESIEMITKLKNECGKTIARIPTCECSSWARLMKVGEELSVHHPKCKQFRK